MFEKKKRSDFIPAPKSASFPTNIRIKETKTSSALNEQRRSVSTPDMKNPIIPSKPRPPPPHTHTAPLVWGAHRLHLHQSSQRFFEPIKEGDRCSASPQSLQPHQIKSDTEFRAERNEICCLTFEPLPLTVMLAKPFQHALHVFGCSHPHPRKP